MELYSSVLIVICHVISGISSSDNISTQSLLTTETQANNSYLSPQTAGGRKTTNIVRSVLFIVAILLCCSVVSCCVRQREQIWILIRRCWALIGLHSCSRVIDEDATAIWHERGESRTGSIANNVVENAEWREEYSTAPSGSPPTYDEALMMRKPTADDVVRFTVVNGADEILYEFDMSSPNNRLPTPQLQSYK